MANGKFDLETDKQQVTKSGPKFRYIDQTLIKMSDTRFQTQGRYTAFRQGETLSSLAQKLLRDRKVKTIEEAIELASSTLKRRPVYYGP